MARDLQTGTAARWTAHLETSRPYTLGYAGFVGLAGAALAATEPADGRWIVAWAVPTLGWLAGLYGGDYFDRALDAIAKPDRPIPSGRLAARTAWLVMVGATLVGGALAFAANPRSLWLVVAAFAIGLSYNTWLKGNGLAGNAVRGSLTAMAFLFGTLCVGAVPPAGLWIVAALLAVHDMGSNLIGTVRDVDGDRRGGVETLAVRAGAPAAVRTASGCWLVWSTIAFALPAWWPSLLPLGVYFAWIALASALGAVSIAMLWAVDFPSPRRSLRAHEVLVIERIVLAGGLVALGAGVTIALPLTLAGVVLTAASQYALRERHEFGRAARAPRALHPTAP